MDTTDTTLKTTSETGGAEGDLVAGKAKSKELRASNQRPVEVESVNAQVQGAPAEIGLAGEYARMDRRYKLEIRRDALAYAISLANGTRPEAEKVVATAEVFQVFLAKED